MPHWLATLLIVAASATTLLTFAGVLRSKVIRPLVATGKKTVVLLEQLLNAANLMREVFAEMRQFAGAFTIFAVGIKEQVDQNTERIDRLEEMRELVIDLQADVQRIDRRHGGGRRGGDSGE